jgi:hypothetical protein
VTSEIAGGECWWFWLTLSLALAIGWIQLFVVSPTDEAEGPMPLPASTPSRRLDAAVDRRPKPEALGAIFSEQARNVAAFGRKTSKLLNLSRCPALQLEEPLQDDRAGFGACAPVVPAQVPSRAREGPVGMGGPNPQRCFSRRARPGFERLDGYHAHKGSR